MRRFRFGICLGILFSIVAVWGASAATYYVASAGNDANNGLSSTSAWRTVNKVNSVNFLAGDRILFEGGKTFAGRIYLDSNDRGTAANPIAIGSYGTGRATISAGSDNGFLAYNTGGILLSNVNFVGAGPASGSKDGVVFYADLAGGVKLAGVTVEDVEVSGFGGAGLVLGAWNGQTGYRNVRFSRVSSHDNRSAGILTYAQGPDVHEDLYAGHCLAFNNFGDPASTKNTGNGIVFGGVNGGVIERCVAHNNGKNNFAPSEGPVGIWTYDSRNVVIQFSESHSNRTSSTKDGGGFDLDLNVRNSVLQYNYSHDNDGAGFLLCGSTSNAGNIVRYNISQNDGRKNGYGAIHTWGNINGAEIYHNTIYLAQTSGSPRAVWLSTAATNIRLRNNVFYSVGGARLVEVAPGQAGVQFHGNCYFGDGGFSIFWNGTAYSTFDAWRNATRQEYHGTTRVGLNADPRLMNAGKGGTLNNATLLPTLTAYKLQTNSPLIDTGLDLTSLFGLNIGPQDFYGTALIQGRSVDIGACELPPPASQAAQPQISSASLANGSFQLSVTAAAGTTNVLEASADLARWIVITNVTGSTGEVQFKEAASQVPGAKFYRIRRLE